MQSPDACKAVVAKQTLSWREQGVGPALLLIHGIGGSSESWEPLFQPLSRHYRAMAWDAPGYGASEILDEEATAESYAALPRLDMPALVIAGEEDPVAPTASCRQIADALADASCETWPGIGHYMLLENPALLQARLENFLGRHAHG